MRFPTSLVFGVILLSACNGPTQNNKTTTPPKVIEHSPVVKPAKRYLISPQTKPLTGQYCYIDKLYSENRTDYIEADYIDFLMGDQAIAAAKAKGDSEVVLDDYYIRNDNKKLRKLELAKDVSILLVETEGEKAYHVESDFNALQQHIKNTVFILKMDNDLVTEIKVQFVP